MKVVELFAGIGGFRLGLGESHEYVYANDMHKDSQKIYKLRFGQDIDPRKIETVQSYEIPNHDLLCGGFPCASFSVAGTKLGFSKDHDKGLLFYEIIRITEDKRPKYILLENVKGILTHDSGKSFAVVLHELGRLGYSVQYQCFNSRNFGTPQNRERVFILGIQGETRQVLPIIPRYETDYIGEVFTTRRDYTLRSYKKGTFPCLMALMGTGGNNVPILREGEEYRKLTPDEAELLQGIPVGHTAGLSDSGRYERIGRSLNPAIIREIAKRMGWND